MSCYCAATSMPPCGWCERSYYCTRCQKLRNQDEDGIEHDSNGDPICEYCIEEMAQKVADNFGGPVKFKVASNGKCACLIQDLMMNGCKCGGK